MVYDRLNYFDRTEFGLWVDLMDETTLERLDRFRSLWRAPVRISPVDGALGRRMAAHKTSMHNVERWGKVFAVDCFPQGMLEPSDRYRAVMCALKAGFSGVGVYPDWKYGADLGGLHLDSRDVARKWGPGFKPALWSAFGRPQKYASIDPAMPSGIGAAEIIERHRVR